MKINIQSVSDVITNSSTEIYTVCTEYTLDRLKDIVNSILKIADSTLTADDLSQKKKTTLKLPNIYLI